MQTTYAQRLRRALEHAELKQAELARRLRARGFGVEQQAIQYLAKEKNNARGSKHTSAIAAECGVDSIWLETGQGEMLGAKGVRQTTARYDVEINPRALVKLISTLNPAVRSALARLLSAVADAQSGSRTYELSKSEASPESKPRATNRPVRSA